MADVSQQVSNRGSASKTTERKVRMAATYDQGPSRGIGVFVAERPEAQPVGVPGRRGAGQRLPELDVITRRRFSRTFSGCFVFFVIVRRRICRNGDGRVELGWQYQILK